MGSDYHRGTDRHLYRDRSRQALEFIASFHEEHGYAPTVREIGDALGLRSSSSAHKILKRLVAEGQLTGRPGTGRTLRIAHATMPARGEPMNG
jgi:SOS-response transcriptional repressor LexA